MVKIKTYIVLLSHGKWSNYLVEDVEKNFGLHHQVKVFPLMPEMALEDYIVNVKKDLKKMDKNSLIIADLFGSTTANVATLMAMEFGFNAITGLSVQTLLVADEELKVELEVSLGDRIVEKNKNLCTNLCRCIGEKEEEDYVKHKIS